MPSRVDGSRARRRSCSVAAFSPTALKRLNSTSVITIAPSRPSRAIARSSESSECVDQKTLPESNRRRALSRPHDARRDRFTAIAGAIARENFSPSIEPRARTYTSTHAPCALAHVASSRRDVASARLFGRVPDVPVDASTGRASNENVTNTITHLRARVRAPRDVGARCARASTSARGASRCADCVGDCVYAHGCRGILNT